MQFKLSNNKPSQCYELLHFDIWDPLPIQSIHGNQYLIIALDDHNYFTLIIHCKSKYEVSAFIQRFVLMIENQHNCKVKVVIINNGHEFSMPGFYSSKMINIKLVVLRSPTKMGGHRGRTNTF